MESSDKSFRKNKGIKFKDFKFVKKNLGRGAYGKVSLVTYKNKPKKYALKLVIIIVR